MKKLLCLILAVLMLAGAFAAGTKKDLGPLWESAAYTENTELGEGKTTITLDVVAGDKTVTFTLKTDKTVLGDVLKEHKLVEGEDGEFGLFIKSVNGIEASWEKDQAYWNVTKSGEMLMTGVDGVTIANGEKYELTYTK